MSENYLSVSMLNGYLKRIVKAEDILQNTLVIGEVSGISFRGAHSYFKLKDDKCSVECCCFNYAKTYKPKDGETVIMRGGIDYYEPYGKITFNANKIEPRGIGLLAQQLEALKLRLLEQGYFDIKHKKAIPKYCSRVCVITSREGAVIRDIITTARKNNSVLDIDVIDVRVQGATAAVNVISALELVDKLGYDAIIIARGGGSFEDLLPFSDENLVYAMFKAVTPIISAIGHESDYSLADLVADVRAATPTAAAELVAYNFDELVLLLRAVRINMENRLNLILERQHTALMQVVGRMSNKAKVDIINSYNQLKTLMTSAKTTINAMVIDKVNRISYITSKLDSNNPIKIIRQGYSILCDANGRHAKVKQLKVDDEFRVMTDGATIVGMIKKIIKSEEKNYG